jgi:hypothetical protein
MAFEGIWVIAGEGNVVDIADEVKFVSVVVRRDEVY